MWWVVICPSRWVVCACVCFVSGRWSCIYLHCRRRRCSSLLPPVDCVVWPATTVSGPSTAPAPVQNHHVTTLLNGFYRQDAAKRQTAGIKFTHRPKISIFAPQGRLVAPIHVKLGTARGTWVRLAMQNFTPIGAKGGNAAPKLQKNSTFW